MNIEDIKKMVQNCQKEKANLQFTIGENLEKIKKVHINTSLFTVVGNRSYFFVNTRAKRNFDRDIEGNAKKADLEWKKISGESPRL